MIKCWVYLSSLSNQLDPSGKPIDDQDKECCENIHNQMGIIYNFTFYIDVCGDKDLVTLIHRWFTLVVSPHAGTGGASCFTKWHVT